MTGNSNERIWRGASDLLSDGIGFVMATIIGHEGSTPRTSGTKMIVTADGGITGTIGGGLLEARVIEKAVRILADGGGPCFMPFDLNRAETETIDMICGGRAEILLDRVTPTAESAAAFKRMQKIAASRKHGAFVTIIIPECESCDFHGADERIESVHHGVATDGRWTDDAAPPLDRFEREKIAAAAQNAASLTVIPLERGRAIVEPSERAHPVFLCGAGHVAQPTAHICAMTGFHVTVLDDREAFANRANFPDAHDIRVIGGFADAFAGLEVDADAFVVIFTRGHLHDRTVLAQALRTPAAYIGMIGSRKKRDAIYAALLAEGFSRADIDRVHSPIGLPIGAQSPEEIAVSIVAEMIQVKVQLSHSGKSQLSHSARARSSASA